MLDRLIDETLVWVTWEELETDYHLPYTRQHVMRMVEAGEFPRPFRLGTGERCRIAWRLLDIREWFATRPPARFFVFDEEDSTPPA